MFTISKLWLSCFEAVIWSCRITKVRLVCKEFKKYVDSSFLLYRNLTFYVQWSRITIYVTMPCGRFTHLTFYSSDRAEVPGLPPQMNRKSINVPNGNFVQAAVDHVMELVNNRKIAFMGFMISLSSGEEHEKRKAMQLLATALEKSDRWLQVQAFTIENQKDEEDLTRIFANIKPKFLKYIYLSGKFTPHLSGLQSRITQMDQWKLAKVGEATDFDMTEAYQYYKHFITCKLVVQTVDLKFYLSVINVSRNTKTCLFDYIHISSTSARIRTPWSSNSTVSASALQERRLS